MDAHLVVTERELPDHRLHPDPRRGRRPRHPRPGRHAEPVDRLRHRRHGHADRLVHLHLRPHDRGGQPHEPVDGHRHHRGPARREDARRRARHPRRPGHRSGGHRGLPALQHRHDGLANPDNDAAGSLAYDNPGTPVPDGELAAAGAGTGIVTAKRTAGSLSGTLSRTPRDRAHHRIAERRRNRLALVGGACDLRGARRHRGRPPRGQALPDHDAPRPRSRALPGRLGGDRHADAEDARCR